MCIRDRDRDVSFKTDFLFPINSYGDWKNSFSFGVVARIKSKSNDEDLYEYEPVKAYEDAFDNEVRGHLVNMTRDNYLPGKYTIGNFPDKKHFGDMQLEGNAKDVYKRQVHVRPPFVSPWNGEIVITA